MQLTGEIVILRPVEPKDYLAIYENMQDQNIALYNGTPYPYSQLDAKEYIKKSMEGRRKKKSLVFGIIEKSSGKLAGIFGLKFVRFDGPVAETGYWLGEKFRSKGYMSEAMEMVLDLAFNKMGIEKVTGRVYLPNRASARIFEKFGFQLEGIQRKEVHRMGLVFDAALYGLLKEEYLRKSSS